MRHFKITTTYRRRDGKGFGTLTDHAAEADLFDTMNGRLKTRDVTEFIVKPISEADFVAATRPGE